MTMLAGLAERRHSLHLSGGENTKEPAPPREGSVPCALLRSLGLQLYFKSMRIVQTDSTTSLPPPAQNAQHMLTLKCEVSLCSRHTANIAELCDKSGNTC